MSVILMNATVRHHDPDIGLDESWIASPNEQILRTLLDTAGNILDVGIVAPVAIPLGTVTTPWISVFKNLSKTDTVQVGFTVSAVFRPACELLPGRWNIIDLYGSHVWQALALLNPVKLSYHIAQKEP